MPNVENDNQLMQGQELCDCPFCGRSICVSLSPIDRQPDGLLHALPMCEKFETMKVEDFATAMRQEIERQESQKAKP